MASGITTRRMPKRQSLLLLSEIDKHKNEIEFLYCVENLSLKQVVEHINKTHNLNGKYHQYRDRLAAWRSRKNITKAEWLDVHRRLSERERLGRKSGAYVCLNKITIIPENRLKRGLDRHVTATDKIFMKAQETAPIVECQISIQSPPSWNDFILPIYRNITKAMLENIPIKITEKSLLEILLPMVSQYPEGSLQVSTMDTNTYFVFLKSVIYSISNNLIPFKFIHCKLEDIDERGYRRPFKTLLSQKLTSITAACERLMPIFYSRGDDEFIEHARKSQPGLISYFSIIRGLLELSTEPQVLESWSSIEPNRDVVLFYPSNFFSPGTIRVEPYKFCLREICDELIEHGIQPTSLLESKLFFHLCCCLEDFAPFFLLTPQNLVSALAVQHSEERIKSLLQIRDIAQIQLLLKAGFRLDYGLEEKLLGVIILKHNKSTREFWLKLWRRQQCLVSGRVATDSSDDDQIPITDFIQIFHGAVQHIYDLKDIEKPERQRGTMFRWAMATEEYGDIMNDLLKNDLPEVALWEMLLIGHLVTLRPSSLNLLLELLSRKYPMVYFETYIFHIVHRMRYHPEVYLEIHYGRETNYIDVLHMLLSRGVDVNFNLDSLISPVSYMIQECSLFADTGYPKDFELESSVLDLLVEAGSDINAPLLYCPEKNIDTKRLWYYQHLRPVDMAYWGDFKEYFCYLLSQDVCLDRFPMKTMDSRRGWIPCPLFIQAAHNCDLKYVSEHWNTRMRWSDAPYLCPGNYSPFPEIEMDATCDIEATKELLDLKNPTPTPTPEELFNLIAVLAVTEGRRSDITGPVLTKTEIECGFALISTAIQNRWVKVGFEMPYRNRFRSPLCLSIIYDNVRLMEHLLNLEADQFIYKDVDMWWRRLSAVQLAAGVSVRLLKALVARGADVNQPPCQFAGSTALHEAIEKGKLSCLSYLLSKGADIHTLDTREHTTLIDLIGEQPVPGKSALEYAIFMGRIDAVSLILQAEPACQPMALEFARKHHQSTIAMYIETWEPGSPENITEDIDEDIEMSL
ncbi:hypothetical protein AOL_s00112g72 [Orbilia oligospora ATCC 24927]|uniref:Clr5 domain-containing protein n=1 Tax=Arthrobotrys oligospora (strain ATCC 24927 / CBS 115.81 / DSM 1491) TaxID=756982 RepID=G1XLP2_ARTOA|nr:hypothetical protein AOL_s00112g72 [Orbilia oligospora ATCC 24927]EGX45883.1 hypothetical protein AOL_s00112g72 [Orbilia oligospora ATCC 24927]